MSRDVVICECFARDGLQNQDAVVPTDLKVQIIDAATEAGFAKIEAVSYGHPKYLPQFADTEDVLRRIRRRRRGLLASSRRPRSRPVPRSL